MRCFLFLSLLLGLPALQAETVGPWDLDALFQPPTFRWEDTSGPVHSLIYQGQPVRGEATEVFAFYASPATLDPQAQGPFPGVVLIHGGGGTAFAEWAWLWARRGYAAIAMDLSGSRPPTPQYGADGQPVFNQASKQDSRTHLEHGGLGQGHPEKFDCIRTPDTSDDWPYHAAANAIRAHSLLRSLPAVDADHTAVTGISWGGYTTCLVASLDSRFQAAVPVYGCGFLYEGESVQKPSIDQLGEHRQAWIEAYDPSRLLTRCRVPILFVNGTNDVHYVLDSYQKSFDAVPGEKHMRIEVAMRHSHPAGWAPEEIGWFIDSKCRGGLPLPELGDPVVQGTQVHAPLKAPSPISEAALHYTTDTGLRSARKWQKAPATVQGSTVTAAAPPAAANTWFLSVTDERGAMITTPVQFQ
ncbi:MAG: prolyl oligopeptidase family serine peptidase [Verrucomicrobiales bacterium]|nr:prolyl oligopeptidase family serine peptidase [Verrucomicrobiales bacterium]